MKAVARLVVLTAWASGMVVQSASAGIVFEQDAQTPTVQSPWSSSGLPTMNLSGFTSLYATYDSFSLANAATVTNLCWQGFSFNADTLGATSLPIQDFQVTFYSNNGGVPGAPLSTETIGYTAQSAGSIDIFGNGQTETIEDYSATLSTGFVAAAGTTYWLSIQAIMPSPALWMWASGTGGDGTSYQVASAQEGGGSFVRPGDRAFTLMANAVPEPNSLALCAVAVAAGLIGRQLRRPHAGRIAWGG